MKFADLVDSGESRWITAKYYDWLDRYRGSNEAEIEADLLSHILTKNEERIRTESWSASSAGSCVRRQQFVYLGKKKPPLDSKSLNIFRNGDYMHLRHQVAGLRMGYLQDVEVPVEMKHLNVKGTIDGICSDGMIAEFKSINSYGFDNLLAPQADHVRQVHAYMMARGVTGARIVYENKNTQQLKEFFVEFDEKISASNVSEWEFAQRGIEDKALAPALPPDSFQCRWCPFSRDCRSTSFGDLA